MEVVSKKLVIEKVLEWFVEYNGGAFDTSAQLRLKKLIEDLPNAEVTKILSENVTITK